jgi:signal transduction histidine kinase
MGSVHDGPVNTRADQPVADTWLAIAAGGAPWSVDDPPTTPEVRLFAFIEAVGLGWVCATIWAATLNSFDSPVGMTPAIAVTVLMLAFGFSVVRRARGRPAPFRSLTLHLTIRLATFAAATIAIYSVTTGWRTLFVLAFAIPASADMALTLHDLGWKPTPRLWWLGWLRSSVHFGVLGAIAAAVTIGNTSPGEAVWILLSLELVAGLTVLGAATCSQLMLETETSRDDAMADARGDERRRRAHWLHDDVCAELRLVSLRVHTERPSPEATTRLLDELDHSLRLRQLDELVETGSVRAAEVLQPYIRRLQSNGVDITAVPTFDDAATHLLPGQARHLARCASVLTSNALQVGATEVALELSRTEDSLVFTVLDNGPGFRDPQLVPGRGMWQLDLDLRPGGIVVDPDRRSGARVTASIALHPAVVT